MDAWVNTLIPSLEYLMSAWITVLEFASFLLFYDAFFPRRFGNRRFYLFATLTVFITYVVVNLLHTQISVLKIAVCLFLFLLTNFVLYTGKWSMRIITTVIWYTLDYLISYSWDLGVTVLFGMTFQEYVCNITMYSASITACSLFLVFLASLVRHLHKPKNGIKYPWAPVILLFPAASLLLLIPLVALFENSPNSVSLVLGCVTVLMIANIGVLFLIDLMEKHMEDREQVLAMNLRVQSQGENIEALSAAYSSQRKLTHDFQHHLAVLSDMVDRQCLPQAAAYLHELQAQQTERIFLVNTHHAAIDAVLNQKAFAAKKQQIDIQFEVNDLSSLRINRVDCTVVLANLLDNAIEACGKLPPPRRWIKMQILRSDAASPNEAVLFVSILNSSPPVKIVHDTIATSKSDPSLHGFGLPNVKELLARHHAEHMMEYKDGVFQFTLEWPDQAA